MLFKNYLTEPAFVLDTFPYFQGVSIGFEGVGLNYFALQNQILVAEATEFRSILKVGPQDLKLRLS